MPCQGHDGGYPSGKKVFVVQTRAFGRSKRVTLGTHGKLATEQARKNASTVIARTLGDGRLLAPAAMRMVLSAAPHLEIGPKAVP